jgi:pimeloyl-ACP methyl ester carboxylesterase
MEETDADQQAMSAAPTSIPDWRRDVRPEKVGHERSSALMTRTRKWSRLRAWGGGIIGAMAAAIEAGNHEPLRQFIENMFLPTSDRRLVENIMAVMLAAPDHVAVNAMRGVLEFDGRAAAALCKVPALHLAATPQRNPPHLMSEWLPNVVNGCTVGAGHFNQLEVPDQVNAMIEAFLRHYV